MQYIALMKCPGYNQVLICGGDRSAALIVEQGGITVDGNRPSKDAHGEVHHTSGDVKRIVRLDDLGRLLREKRQREQLTLEQAAHRSGVSAATLSRLERQKVIGDRESSSGIPSTPDTRTLSALSRWLSVSIESILHVDQPLSVEGVTHHEGESTPDIVTAHLRADRNLDSKTAEALGRLFRSAYEQFSLLSNAKEEQPDPVPGDSAIPSSTRSRELK
jgi:transcriptional regulator with XRE-family HTH domain